MARPPGVSEDVAVLQESLGAYTRMAHAFRRQLRFRPALRSLRSALGSCDALEASAGPSPSLQLLRAKTRLNVSAVLGDLGEQLEARREAARAKEELTKTLLDWWEREGEDRKPFLYADPIHIESVSCVCMAHRTLGQLEDCPASSRAYWMQALQMAVWLLPKEHPLPRFLRAEIEEKGYGGAELAGLMEEFPEAVSLLQGRCATAPSGLDMNAADRVGTPMSRGRTSPKVCIDHVDDEFEPAHKRGSKERMSMRPQSSPGDFSREKTQAADPFEADKLKRGNAFSEFRSTNDADNELRKLMLLDDLRQKNLRLSMRRQKSLLNDELRAKTPDELYDNKVLFSATALGVHGSHAPRCDMDEVQRRVSSQVRMLGDSQRKAIGASGDLSLLVSVGRDKTKDRSGSKARKKRGGELPVLSGADRFELQKLGVQQDEVEKLRRVYGKCRGPDGNVSKDMLAKALERRKEFSSQRFEGLWRTIDIKGNNDVKFMELARWCRRCLPYDVAP